MQRPRSFLATLGAVAALGLAGCHHEVELPPLPETKISIIGDRFFDVKALSPERALVVGYRGRMLETSDFGRSWNVIQVPTDRALYSISFADDKNGWICGQSGVILHTKDGGKTWTEQRSNTDVYLFALHNLGPTHVFAVGDRSTLVETTDGGATWTPRKIQQSREGITEEEAIVAADPIFYDLEFTDEQHGWIVGEFGMIKHTADGGKTWVDQQATLLGEGIVDMLDLPTFFGVHFLNGQEGMAAGLEGKIARTHNGGEMWAFEPVDEKLEVADPLYSPFFFPDGKGWAIGSGGEVLTIEPGQQAWKRARLGMRLFTWLRGIDFFDQNTGWIVGGFGTILKTKDGGKTWTPSLA